MNIHKSEEKIYTNQAYTVQLMVELQEKSLVFSMFISIFGGIVGMLISEKCVEILHYESDNTFRNTRLFFSPIIFFNYVMLFCSIGKQFFSSKFVLNVYHRRYEEIFSRQQIKRRQGFKLYENKCNTLLYY